VVPRSARIPTRGRSRPSAARCGGGRIDPAEALAHRLGVALDVERLTRASQYRVADFDIIMDTVVDEDALEERQLRWSASYLPA